MNIRTQHFELPEQSKGYIGQLNVMSNHFLPHLHYPMQYFYYCYHLFEIDIYVG